MKKNDKGQTVVQISYEKGKTNGRKIVCGTEAEQSKYWEEYEAKNGDGRCVVDIGQSCGQSHKKG